LLDWLLFDDPAIAPLCAALQAGSLQWVATAPMLDELSHVLRRPALLKWAPSEDRVAAAISHCCRIVEPPADGAPALPCADPDDQKFIDLALARSAAWLFSRDKA